MTPERAIPADESRLLEAARGGDRAAFGTLVLDAAPMLERLSLRLVRHRQDAEDVTQEAVAYAWRRLPSFQGKARLRTWLYRITVSRALDLLRKRRVTGELPQVAAPAAHGPSATAQAHELEGAVRDAIESLPPVQRATLLLRVDQAMSYDEIAYVLGSTRNAVRMNLVAARKQLAHRLRNVVDLGEGGRS